MIRKRIHYFGDVQGVGFRFTSCSVAREFDVAGHVHNCRDGSVELIVEGERKEVDRFLKALRDRMSSHIDRDEIAEEPATGEFGGFSVLYRAEQ